MKLIKVGSPFPRNNHIPFTEVEYPIGKSIKLEEFNEHYQRNFLEVLENRRTRYEFGKISFQRLSHLLWLVGKTRFVKKDENNTNIQFRTSPSAGGRHPIDIFVIQRVKQTRAYYYNPISHNIGELDCIQSEIDELVNHIDSFLPLQDATLFLFVAQIEKTLSKYENGDSLIWRDSGALLSTIYLSAEYLEMNCSGLGITGEPWISNSLSQFGDKIHGVGGCLIGERKQP